MAVGEALLNDPANPCIGCGPKNPVGLQLAFERAEAGAATSLVATRDREGWPDRLHSAVLYLAMLETANWSVWAHKDRVGLPRETSALALKKWVATGDTVRIEGRVVADDAAGLRVAVTATAADGALVATLERAFVLATKDALVKGLGYDQLPAVLEGLVPDA